MISRRWPFRGTFARLATLAALLLPSPAPGQEGQSDPSSVPSAETTVVEAIQSASPAVESGEGPVQPMLPMSMRPFYHVFAAFGVAWLLIFGYAVSVRRRLATLEEEVDRLSR